MNKKEKILALMLSFLSCVPMEMAAGSENKSKNFSLFSMLGVGAIGVATAAFYWYYNVPKENIEWAQACLNDDQYGLVEAKKAAQEIDDSVTSQDIRRLTKNTKKLFKRIEKDKNRIKQLKKLKKLIEKYPETNLNVKNEKGKTLLYRAVESFGPSEIVRLLVEKGANVNEKNSDGTTPLHFLAGWEGAADPERIARYFFAQGGDPDAKNGGLYPTPHQIAARVTSTKFVKLCIENGSYLEPNDYHDNEIKAYLALVKDVKELETDKRTPKELFKKHNDLFDNLFAHVLGIALGQGLHHVLAKLYVYDTNKFCEEVNRCVEDENRAMCFWSKNTQTGLSAPLNAGPSDGARWFLQLLRIAIECGKTRLFKVISGLALSFENSPDVWQILKGTLLHRELLNKPKDEKLVKEIKALVKAWENSKRGKFKAAATRFMKTKFALDQYDRPKKIVENAQRTPMLPEVTTKVLGFLGTEDFAG
ncbi:MAG: ankyrin repeat domain-containing protein [Candidatus Dependentiae bacterium]|nr:ankyrin repeat domain-containing protein [Candidatus Dependentiae bacterium]